MTRRFDARQADLLLWAAFGAWILNCAQPALGMLVQFALIIYCVIRCDVKVIPALLLLVLSRGNLALFRSSYMALRLGITISPGSMLAIAVFFFSILRMLTQRYDGRTMFWGIVWLASLIPASLMSFAARSQGLAGVWSYPIMDALVPGIYFWSISAGKTYAEGCDYLFKRLMLVLALVSVFCAIRVFWVFSFFEFAFPLCVCLYVLSHRMPGRWKFCAVLGVCAALFGLVFGRAIALQQMEGYVTEADKYGSTFTRMGVVVSSLLFSHVLGRRILAKGLLWLLPIAIVASNVLFVTFVLTTQAGNEAKEINWNAEEFDERVTAKVFGDRAGVWKIGWEEVRTPPYFIKDIRSFYVFDPVKGYGLKLLPHNQFLTLLGREGFWLGLTLSLWIIAVWCRALTVCHDLPKDDPMRSVYLPVGLAVFAVVGLSGQSVVAGDMWANALVAIILPGVVYGHGRVWRMRRNAWS